MCIFNSSNVTLMVKEMDIMKEIKQSEQNETRKLNIFRLFILIPHLRIYKLPAAVCNRWFSETPQAAGNVFSDVRCLRQVYPLVVINQYVACKVI